MENVLPKSIAYKLGFLKLTHNGKITLSVFGDKILYKGLDLLQRTHTDKPDSPFNVYYAYCMFEARRLGMEPLYENLNKFVSFNAKADMTSNCEKFDMKKCHHFMNNVTKIRPSMGARFSKSTNRRSNSGPTFKEGVTYWKYGKEYKYPDQALDEGSNPTQPDPTYVAPLPQDDPQRAGIDQIEQIKKAIRSGDINKKGLQLLREAFIVRRPEVIEIIDAYLAGCLDDEKTTPPPDDTQEVCEIIPYGPQNLPF